MSAPLKTLSHEPGMFNSLLTFSHKNLKMYYSLLPTSNFLKIVTALIQSIETLWNSEAHVGTAFSSSNNGHLRERHHQSLTVVHHRCGGAVVCVHIKDGGKQKFFTQNFYFTESHYGKSDRKNPNSRWVKWHRMCFILEENLFGYNRSINQSNLICEVPFFQVSAVHKSASQLTDEPCKKRSNQ